MLQSLTLAREVQQNLLPKENLIVRGFDIAGKSVYCDQTGVIIMIL
jgi:sigma-B regulation protein RsbU (phosphoserine phosphatase)